MTDIPKDSVQKKKPEQLVRQALFGLTRRSKARVLQMVDIVVIAISVWASASMSGYSSAPLSLLQFIGLALPAAIAGLFCYRRLGLYRSMLRAMDSRAVLVVGIGAIFASLVLFAAGYFVQGEYPSLLLIIMFALLVVFGVGSTRLILREAYQLLANKSFDATRIIIYGAGAAGTQLASYMDTAPEYRVVAFLDDDPKLHGLRIGGHRIHGVEDLEQLNARYRVNQIVLTMNTISKRERRAIVSRLAPHNVPIRSLAGMADLFDKGFQREAIQPLKIEDLLGRQPVEPIAGLIEEGVAGKRILVTGAGGSIGQEICQQLMQTDISELVALDSNELGLYRLSQKLADGQGPERLKLTLGSILDRPLVKSILRDQKIDLVYHCAAYKHVPLVEDNAIASYKNNVLGTKIVAEEAAQASVERFTLISTDKAVRPTNVMGASKRLAELVIQDIHTRSENTVFSMVRFGNVLGSSGSVVPLFEEQIARGGPITLTHKEVTRYFMTVSEAAQLVLQAGMLSKGGEVFLLDMGEPVKLAKLADIMIQLSRGDASDFDADDAEIEIREIGLRPGEKLYEELLIGADSTSTDHPKIMCATETKLSSSALTSLLNALDNCVANHDEDGLIDLLAAEPAIAYSKTH